MTEKLIERLNAHLPLPFNPKVCLSEPDQELVIEYERISGLWSVYVQKVLRRIFNHDVTAIKKNKRPLPPHIKDLIIRGIQANEPSGLIARKVGVQPQTVYDQKYSLLKERIRRSIRDHSGAST